MKKTTWSKTGALASVALATAGVAGAFVLASNSNPAPAAEQPLAALSRVSAPELPAAAARLVTEAAPEARAATAREVVRAVNALSGPTVLPFVVGAISEADPASASAVVGEAVALQPDLNLAVVRAAATAAPAQTEFIVATSVRQQPAAFNRVALVAAQAAPSRATEVLQGLGAGLPQLQPMVNRAVAQSPVAPQVPAIVAQVNNMVVSAARGELAAVRAASTTPAADALYAPLVAGTQKGPPVVTPLTPPVIPPIEVPVTYSTPQSGNNRDTSAP